MKRLLISLLLAASLAASLSSAPACAAGSAGVTVLRPWSRPAAAGTNAIGYMVVANRGPAADSLEEVTTPLAARVEIHSSSMAGGVMSMKHEDRVAVPAGGQVVFGPGAYHLMILGVTRTLKAGDAVPATLRFASGAKIRTRFVVTSGLPPN